MSTSPLVLTEDSITDIQALFLGRRVVDVDMDQRTLRLDNGALVTITPNEGGCGCGAGDYELTSLRTVDNIITDVRVVNDPSGDDSNGTGYRIFVYANAEMINLMSVDGDDGNGYYGTGYHLTVTFDYPTIHEEADE